VYVVVRSVTAIGSPTPRVLTAVTSVNFPVRSTVSGPINFVFPNISKTITYIYIVAAFARVIRFDRRTFVVCAHASEIGFRERRVRLVDSGARVAIDRRRF